jgi:hypothetical protein
VNIGTGTEHESVIRFSKTPKKHTQTREHHDTIDSTFK